MEIRRLYLDANIIIMLGEGAGEITALLTELAIQQEPEEFSFLCTSELTLAEVLVHPHRRQDDDLIDRYEGWLARGGFLELGPVHREVLRYAALVRSSYSAIKLPDAIHVSTAIGLECSHFLTAGTGLPDTIELAQGGHGLTKGSAKLEMLRPDPKTLKAIILAQRAQ